MTGRDDFENRLGQGLKRWAQAGEPSMDLEALVRERMGEQPDATTAEATARTGTRTWTRWLGGMAAAAAIVMSVGLTFPSWAGAAASWPLVGPFVTQMILEDAGLKWAYDMGLIDGNVAEVTQNGITVRILGVVADSRRTTVLYLVQGVPPTEPQDDPAPRWSSWITPPDDRSGPPVSGFITKVNGQGASSSSSGAEGTPLGYIGITSTTPLEMDQAELELAFRIDGGEEITLTVPASREQSDRFSREVAVNQTLEHDGVRVTVEAVIYTPAETVVRYREEKEYFMGSYSWSEDMYDYLEVNGQQYRQSGGGVTGVNDVYHMAFPPVEGPARLVLKPAMKGSPIDAVWPLEEGAVAEVMGVPIKLVQFQHTADGIGFRWEGPESDLFRGIGSFEVIDSQGVAHRLGGSWSSTSNWADDGVRHQHYSGDVPEGIEPVAVRATQAAVLVEGPWVFDLPR